MKIKLPSGKVVAYTVGRSVLVIKDADVNIVGKDFSARINDPENPDDSITVAVEDGDVQLESILEEEQHGKESKKNQSEADDGEEPEGDEGESGGESDEPSGEPGGDDDSASGQPGDGEQDGEPDGGSEDGGEPEEDENPEDGDEESPEDLGGDDGNGTKKKDSRRYTRIRR